MYFPDERKECCNTLSLQTILDNLLMPRASVNRIPIGAFGCGDRNHRIHRVQLTATAHSFALWVTVTACAPFRNMHLVLASGRGGGNSCERP